MSLPPSLATARVIPDAISDITTHALKVLNGDNQQACLKRNRYATVTNVNANTQVITNTVKTRTTGYNTLRKYWINVSLWRHGCIQKEAGTEQSPKTVL